MTAQQLIDQLNQQCATRAHRIAMGRATLAASYNRPIEDTLRQLEALGYDGLACLDAVAA